MRPLELYDLGMELAARADGESVQRSAVNRLYYGLLHEACCRYFRVNPSAAPIPRSRRHREVGDRFRSKGDETSLNIVRLLRILAGLRTECDYNLTRELMHGGRAYPPSDILTIAVDFAGEILAALEEYSPGEAEDGCNCPAI